MVDKRERLEFLETEVAKHKELYENGEPIITDSEYDALYFELLELIEELGENIEESAIASITAPSKSGLKKVKHDSFVGSLAKATTQDKIEKFLKLLKMCVSPSGYYQQTLLVQPKCDGLTIVATYENGILVQALTRGNGDYGEDVTESVKMMKNIPQKISYKKKLKIRFEAMISKKSFDEINIEGNFSNARNLVAGTIRQTKDLKLVAKRKVFGVVFDILYIENTADLLTEQYSFLKKLGFDVVPSYIFEIAKITSQELFDFCNRFNNNERDKLEYKIDGLVFKANYIPIHKKLGERFNNPRWALAFKFPSMDASTILRNVEFSVGRTGRITPVAEFDSIMIDNVSISRATLHNQDYINTKNLHIGDRIVVARQNDVIPAIIANVKVNGGKKVSFPDVCPCCGHKLSMVDANYYCTNKDCKEQNIQGIISWCSKDRANIVGMSEKRVRQLYDKGFIKNIQDIYSLPDKWKELAELPRWGFTLLESLITSIEESKNITFAKFIYGLGIPNVGAYTAELIAEKFPSLDKILEITNTTGLGELKSISGIGETTAQDFCNFIFEHKDDITSLEKILKVEYPISKSSGKVFSGKTFVFTGTLSQPRTYFEGLVKNNGGEVGNSVTRKTTYLVAGPGHGSKYQKATTLGIKIITEREFLSMLI